MKTSLLFCSALMGLTTLWAAPALAQEAPASTTTTSTTVVQPAPAPAPASTTVVMNQPSSGGVVETTTTQGHPGLIWGGVALWGVAYSASAITVAVANDACTITNALCVNGRGVLFVPVVGPFIAMAGVNNGTGSSTMKTMLAIDGAFQLGGVAMVVTGLVMSASERHTVRAAALRKEPKLMVTPYATATSAGLGAVGHF